MSLFLVFILCVYIYYAFERSSSIEFIIRDENFFKVTFFEITSRSSFFFFLVGLVVLLRRCDGRDRREYNDV